MCVIASIYNTSKNKNGNDFLVENLLTFQKNNGDGTAFYGFDTEKESKTGYKRIIEKKQQNSFNNLLDKYNVSHFHFRNATQGIVDKSNIHFWKYKNWIMAHNGQVYDLGEFHSNYSDSNMLFRIMAKSGCLEKDDLDINKINHIVSRQYFWGRLLFVNTESKQAYYFGDFYISAVDKNVLVVSTTKLQQENISLHGFIFQTTTDRFIDGKVEGIFRIDIKNQKQPLKMYKLKFNQTTDKYSDPYPYTDLSDRDIPPTKKSHKTQGKFIKI